MKKIGPGKDWDLEMRCSILIGEIAIEQAVSKMFNDSVTETGIYTELYLAEQFWYLFVEKGKTTWQN